MKECHERDVNIRKLDAYRKVKLQPIVKNGHFATGPYDQILIIDDICN
jgi:hypothetical protein